MRNNILLTIAVKQVNPIRFFRIAETISNFEIIIRINLFLCQEKERLFYAKKPRYQISRSF